MTLLNESVPPARVILLDNFISEEERAEMVARARPRLTSATVNQDGDNQALSSYRRSQAANVVADMRKEDDPITRVSARAFEVTNALGGYDLNHFGQEPFSVIQCVACARAVVVVCPPLPPASSFPLSPLVLVFGPSSVCVVLLCVGRCCASSPAPGVATVASASGQAAVRRTPEGGGGGGGGREHAGPPHTKGKPDWPLLL